MSDLLGLLNTDVRTAYAGPYAGTDVLTPETLRAAIEAVRNDTHYLPSAPDPISPAAHDAVNDLLGRPSGTPVTRFDMAAARQALWDRATPEERDRLLYYALGGRPG